MDRAPAVKVPDPVRRAVRRRLLPWFAENARDLPWRRRRTPYRVWVAEIMLQQTRADQALPYYRRFLRRFPSMKSLAVAPLDDVLKMWEGLGYYRRARNLHRAARMVRERPGGRFPDTLEGIRALPGVGAYTAAAVASLAFNLDAAVVDGNVRRVVCRLLGRTLTARELEAASERLLVRGRAGEYNEAVMELGALVCTPAAPACDACPMRSACAAYRSGDPHTLPEKARRGKKPHRKVAAGVVFNGRGEVLIAQRNPDDMLGGLWEFPGGCIESGETAAEALTRELREELGMEVCSEGLLITVRHAYSHFSIEMEVHLASRVNRAPPRPLQCAAARWVPVDRLRGYAFSRADLQVIEALECRQAPVSGEGTTAAGSR
ncbi:A/G-specific adenine glycosylase [Kiritimatiella glycovorans]|nr:A/G-specific adenine glycosylase [Kiritimatiella glycovorans]